VSTARPDAKKFLRHILAGQHFRVDVIVIMDLNKINFNRHNIYAVDLPI